MPELTTTLSWRIFPLTEDARKTVIFVLVAVLCIAVVQFGFQEPWLTALAAVFLLGSLRMFWSPTWYELTKDGVVVQTLFYRVTHNWERFKVVKDDPRGLLLTPFRSDSRLETFRGLFLRLPPGKPELKASIRKQCEEFLGIVDVTKSNAEEPV